jgi:molybdopterin/thiamine biosynthesis adenylyltransferase/rhodanese-related sulfurtransferase
MSKTYVDLLREVREEIREVTPREADALRTGASAALVDVREAGEWELGHVVGARLVPKSHLEQEIEAAVPDRSTPVVLYCTAGVRSLFAGRALRAMGYRDVVSMAGGFEQWKSLGLPWTRSDLLTEEQRRRYSRHLLIPEVGTAGQARLLASKVLVVGAGGLGSPAALYLAAAGVGTIGIVDFDVVDLSNLQRQVLHATDRLGEKKVVSAAVAIHALNPDVEVIAHDEVLGPGNVDRLIAGYDVVLDGTDTFETRYTLNDAAVAAGITVVHASVFRFEGQLTTFVPHSGPCYRCLYPTPPPPELAPGCSVAGVLGVVPGIMGLLQANEVLKVLLGIGDPLVGRLLLFDALEASFTELKLRRDPACPACSDAAVAARAVGVAPPAAGGSAPATAPAAPDGAALPAAPGPAVEALDGVADAATAPATEALRFPFPPPSHDVPA